MKMFSFIIPVYNTGKYLFQCIKSIADQDDKDMEIILVNDGSTDDSGDICNQLAIEYDFIKVIHKPNGGVAAARCDGLEISTGEYIFFVDSDDWVANTLMKEIKRIIKDNKVDIICYGIYEENSSCQFIEHIPKYDKGLYEKKNIENIIFPILLSGGNGDYFSPSLAEKCIKKSLCKDIMIADNRATVGEDGAVSIISIYNSNRLYILDKCLYYYRYNETSATKSRKVFNWDYPEVINKHIEKHINLNHCDFRDQLYRKIVHDVIRVIITRFYQKLSYSEIKTEILANLNRPFYKEAIYRAKFNSNLKFSILLYALRMRLIFLFYALSYLKQKN